MQGKKLPGTIPVHCGVTNVLLSKRGQLILNGYNFEYHIQHEGDDVGDSCKAAENLVVDDTSRISDNNPSVGVMRCTVGQLLKRFSFY